MNDFQDVIIDAIESNLNGLDGVSVAYESGVAMNYGSIVVLNPALDVLGRVRLNFQTGYWVYEIFDGHESLVEARTVNGNARTVSNSQALATITEWGANL